MHFDVEGITRSRINARVSRYIDGDEDIGTSKMADGVGDQNRLDELVDDLKPPIKPSNKHYLLRTPFRYPPLEYGSRFGHTMMPSFFYGSMTLKTALAEAAYYFFLLQDHMSIPFDEPLVKHLRVFQVRVQSRKVLDLTRQEFSELFDDIIHPKNYSVTQTIGEAAVIESDFEVIKYPSARHESGVNVAVSVIEAIESNNPENLTRAIMLAGKGEVKFLIGDEQHIFDSTILHSRASQ